MERQPHPGGWIGWWVLAGVAIPAGWWPAARLVGPFLAVPFTLLPIPVYFVAAELLGRVKRSAGKWARSIAPHVLVGYYALLLLAGLAVEFWG